MLWLVADVRVDGAEKLECDGAYLLCGNHLHLLDSILIYSIIPASKHVGAVAANKWRANPITRWILESIDIVWIRRGEVDRVALKSVVAQLKRGHVVGIAPEGTRSKTGALQQAHNGATWLARAADAPIIPVAHWGIEQIGFLKRPTVQVHIGDSMVTNRNLGLAEDTCRLMLVIAAMLPAKYRGYYASEESGCGQLGSEIQNVDPLPISLENPI